MYLTDEYGWVSACINAPKKSLYSLPSFSNHPLSSINYNLCITFIVEVEQPSMECFVEFI